MATAEELLLLGALLNAANNSNEGDDEAMENESHNWNVICKKCDTPLRRVKGHEAYGTSPNSTIQCDGCAKKIQGTRTMFHCPKNQNLFHLNGFDYCLSCANENREQQSLSNNNNSNANIHFQRQYSPQPQQTQSSNNNNNSFQRRIDEQRQTIERMSTQMDEERKRSDNYKEETQKKIRALSTEKDNLITEKRRMSDRINDKLNIIDDQNEQIANLKRLNENSSNKQSSMHSLLQSDVSRLQKEKLELQQKYRDIETKLDDKLDVIDEYQNDNAQLKSKMEEMNQEKEKMVHNYNKQLSNKDKEKQTPGKKNEISPTLKAIFTQKFFADEESNKMPHKKYISTLHNEILGMSFASHATLEWMNKNCKMYDDEAKHNDEQNNDSGFFSFNQFAYGMNGNENNSKIGNSDNSNKDNDYEKPLVNLKEFDLMTIQKLSKNLIILNNKYKECIESTNAWSDVLNDIINPSFRSQSSGIQNINNKSNGNVKQKRKTWREWESEEVVNWIVGLENGRFLKYQSILRREMARNGLNGIKLIGLQIADLLMFGVGDFNDQMALNGHITALTGRDQNNNANPAYTFPREGSHDTFNHK